MKTRKELEEDLKHHKMVSRVLVLICLILCFYGTMAVISDEYGTRNLICEETYLEVYHLGISIEEYCTDIKKLLNCTGGELNG